MEWVLAAVVLWLLRARRRDRRTAAASRGGPTRPVRSPDGREVLNVEGSLFAPASPDEPGWAWVGVEGTTAAQVQHTTTIGAVIAGPGNAGGGRPGPADGVLVEAVPVLLLPTGRRRRVAAVDVYATGGRLGHLPEAAVARHGHALRDVIRIEGRPAGVEGRILRGPDGVLGTEVLLPDAFEPTPPGRGGGRG